MAEAAPTPADWLEFLIDSARYGDTEDVRTALKEGAEVDGTDDGGRTGETAAAAPRAAAPGTLTRAPAQGLGWPHHGFHGRAAAALLAPLSCCALHRCALHRCAPHRWLRRAAAHVRRQRCIWPRPTATWTS
jgi:hypothetical protein